MKNKMLTSFVILNLLFPLVSCNSNDKISQSTSDVEISNPSNNSVVILYKYESLPVGYNDVTLKAIVDNYNGSQEVKWSSSDVNVATVDNGILKIKNIGKTTISVSSVANSNWTDSFILNVTGIVIKGVVSDFSGNLLDKAKVSYGKFETTSNENGEYVLQVDKVQKNIDLTISKDGYNSQNLNVYNEIIAKEIVKNIKLLPSSKDITLTIKGRVKNVINGYIEGANITLNNSNISTDNDGSFEFVNVELNEILNLSIFKDGYEVQKYNLKIEDYLEELNNTNNLLDLGVLDLYSKQDNINFYKRDLKEVNGHIYRTNEGIRFILNSNFDINNDDCFFELFLDFGESNPSDFAKSDNRDMDFKFDSNGIYEANKYKDIFGDGQYIFNYSKEGNIYTIDITLPYSYIKMDIDEIFGFNLITHTDDVNDRSLNLYGNYVEWYNYYTYPRLDVDNGVYQATSNKIIYDLSVESIVKSEVLGVIGVDSKYQYKLSIAKDEKGLYLITEKVDSSLSYILDGTKYHLFIDTEQFNFDRATDNKVHHFELEAGRWLKKYQINSASDVFSNPKGLDSLKNSGVNIYSERGMTITYLPYDLFGNGFNNLSTIGIAANIEEGSYNYQKWQEPYISGYINEPHVEEIKSFVRLDKDLKVI